VTATFRPPGARNRMSKPMQHAGERLGGGLCPWSRGRSSGVGEPRRTFVESRILAGGGCDCCSHLKEADGRRARNAVSQQPKRRGGGGAEFALLPSPTLLGKLQPQLTHRNEKRATRRGRQPSSGSIFFFGLGLLLLRFFSPLGQPVVDSTLTFKTTIHVAGWRRLPSLALR
jgi:hypothetical protein